MTNLDLVSILEKTNVGFLSDRWAMVENFFIRIFSCDPDNVSRVSGNYLEHSGKYLGARNVDGLGVFFRNCHDFPRFSSLRTLATKKNTHFDGFTPIKKNSCYMNDIYAGFRACTKKFALPLIAYRLRRL